MRKANQVEPEAVVTPVVKGAALVLPERLPPSLQRHSKSPPMLERGTGLGLMFIPSELEGSARAFAEAGKDQVSASPGLWGSCWPHVAVQLERKPGARPVRCHQGPTPAPFSFQVLLLTEVFLVGSAGEDTKGPTGLFHGVASQAGPCLFL